MRSSSATPSSSSPKRSPPTRSAPWPSSRKPASAAAPRSCADRSADHAPARRWTPERPMAQWVGLIEVAFVLLVLCGAPLLLLLSRMRDSRKPRWRRLGRRLTRHIPARKVWLVILLYGVIVVVRAPVWG